MPPEFSLMPRIKSINFYQNKPKIKLFLQKKIFFECWGLRAGQRLGLRAGGSELEVDMASQESTMKDVKILQCWGLI